MIRLLFSAVIASCILFPSHTHAVPVSYRGIHFDNSAIYDVHLVFCNQYTITNSSSFRPVAFKSLTAWASSSITATYNNILGVSASVGAQPTEGDVIEPMYTSGVDFGVYDGVEVKKGGVTTYNDQDTNMFVGVAAKFGVEGTIAITVDGKPVGYVCTWESRG